MNALFKGMMVGIIFAMPCVKAQVDAEVFEDCVDTTAAVKISLVKRAAQGIKHGAGIALTATKSGLAAVARSAQQGAGVAKNGVVRAATSMKNHVVSGCTKTVAAIKAHPGKATMIAATALIIAAAIYMAGDEEETDEEEIAA